MENSINVTLTIRDSETNKIKKVIKKHNLVSKQAILTIARLIDGQFCDANNPNLNRTKRYDLYDYIPHYFAMGSNVASAGSAGTTNIASINDTRLLSEFTEYPRMKITQRNLVEDDPNKPYVKLVIKHYVPVSAYRGEDGRGQRIGEAGLFTSEKGNTCWARVTFDSFVKEPLTVIDVEWEITIVSLESTSELYESIDKSSLWNAIEDVCIKLEEKDPSLVNLPMYLKQGIYDYASDEATQEIVDEDTDNLNSCFTLVPPVNNNPATYTGTIISDGTYDCSSINILVSDMNDSGNVLSTFTPDIASGTFTFTLTPSDFPSGKCMIKFTKVNHLSLSIINVPVVGDNIISLFQQFTLYPGDYNGDGIIDSDDEDILNLVTSGPNDPLYDLNGDGVTDLTESVILANNIGLTSQTLDYNDYNW